MWRILRRAAFRAVLFLLVGAIINVALAWGIAWLVPAMTSSVEERQGIAETRSGKEVLYSMWGGPGIQIIRWQWSWMGTPFHAWDASNIGPPTLWSRIESIESFPEPGGGGRQSLDEIATGWPVRSMYCRWRKSEDHWFVSGLELRPIVSASGEALPRYLPRAPAWHGFALNTLFLAALLWSLIRFVRLLRWFAKILQKHTLVLKSATNVISAVSGQALRRSTLEPAGSFPASPSGPSSLSVRSYTAPLPGWPSAALSSCAGTSAAIAAGV